MKPRIYESEGVLLNFIKKSTEADLARYMRSLYSYIDALERKVDIEDLDGTADRDADEKNDEDFPDPLNIFFDRSLE